jgi:hypothetical protein
MTKADLVGPMLRSVLAACTALAPAMTASAAPTTVSELPREFWGKECFGPAPSQKYPGTMWYVLLRVGADGKQIETWSTYGPPGRETPESVAATSFKEHATQFTAWGDGGYIVPITSPRASLPLFITLTGNQVQFALTNGVTGKADCKKLP